MKFTKKLQNKVARLKILSEDQLKKAGLTKEELEELEILADPILWCEHNLNDPLDSRKHLTFREMQKVLVREDAPKVAVRTARRTGKSVSIAARVIYQAILDPKARVLILTPYQSQIEEVFTAIMGLLDGTRIRKAIKRSVAHPYYLLEFKNGSTIRGMPVGGKLSRRGSPVRGKGAKYLYLDEFDYLPEEIVATILIILKTQEDSELWVSSTPSGSRSYFYNWCMEPKKNDFVTHFFGKEYIPNWTAQDDAFYKRQYNENHWQREICGEWGEELIGVFRHQFIDESLFRYTHNMLQHNPKNKYIIGVDWNTSEIGTRIVVLEYILSEERLKSDNLFLDQINKYRTEQNKIVGENLYPPVTWEDCRNKYRVFRIESIQAGEFTQTRAVERIIQLYYSFFPEFICVDAGYGDTQVEMLRKYALDKKDKILAEKIIPYNMASTIERVDPLTKLKIAKRFKPLMVNTAVQTLETGSYILPVSEDDQNLLVGQMRQYTVLKISVSGDPIYSQGEEHTLTAFMLAVFGFEHNFGILAEKNLMYREREKIKISTNPLIMKNDIQSRKIESNPDGKIGKLASFLNSKGIPYSYTEKSLPVSPGKRNRQHQKKSSIFKRSFTKPN